MEKQLRSSTEKLLKAALVWMLAVYLINFLCFGFLIGPFDYDHLSSYYELAYRFWKTGGGIPQYNPFLCGGRTLAGDPQIPIFHPLIALVPILGPTLLLKCEMLGQLALGIYGLVQLLRFFGAGKLGVYWGSFLFATGGAIVARFMVGHATLGFYFLYPLFLYLSYRLQGTGGRAKIFAAYLVLFVYAGLYKPNFLIYGVPPLLIEVIVRAALRRQPRLILAFGVAVVTCVLVNAVTYLPAAKYFADFPRLNGSLPYFARPYTLIANLLLPLKAIPIALYGPNALLTHEYNLFLGPLALLFAWFGIRAFGAEKRPEKIALLMFAGVSVWLGMGSLSEGWSPFFLYTWFRPLWPGFQSVRVPTRLWFGLYLTIVIFSAVGFRQPSTRAQWRWLLWLGILPLVLSATVNLSKTTVLAAQPQWHPSREFPKDIRLMHTDHPDHNYSYLREGYATIDCVENMEVYRAKDLREANLLSVETKDTVMVRAVWEDWHRIRITASAEKPFQFSLNMNHSDYWRFEGAGNVVSKRGEKISVASAGSDMLGHLIFEQPLAREAALTSGLSALILLFFLGFTFWGSRRKNIKR